MPSHIISTNEPGCAQAVPAVRLRQPRFEDQPGWTSHDAGASRFDSTLRLPGRVRRELGHIDRRGLRRVGVLVVEFDAWVPVTLAAAEPMPA